MVTVLVVLFAIFVLALPVVDSAAYCTYHLYTPSDSLAKVSCSDGANGIMTKMKYSNISPFWPYVTAYNGAGWNSPNCGRCVKATSNAGTSVYLTVIDMCGPPPGGYDAHFDISQPAFNELFGANGVQAGVQSATWQFVSSSMCIGNIGPSSAFGDTSDISDFVAQDELDAAVADPSADPCPPCPVPPPCESRAFSDTDDDFNAAVADPSTDPCPPCPPLRPCASRAIDASTDPSSTSTTPSAGIQGWAIGLIVMFAIVTVGLIAVIVQLIVVLRQRSL